jgi:hypothetical protein
MKSDRTSQGTYYVTAIKNNRLMLLQSLFIVRTICYMQTHSVGIMQSLNVLKRLDFNGTFQTHGQSHKD